METLDVWLREWEAIMRRIESIDARLWQGAGILLVFSMGGISVLSWTPPNTREDVILGCVVGLFSIAVLIVWWFIFHRWIRLQRVYTHRAMEIEDKLDLRFNMYGSLFQHWNVNTKEINELKGKLKERDASAYYRLEAKYKYLQKTRSARMKIETAFRWLTVILGLAWLAFIILYAVSY